MALGLHGGSRSFGPFAATITFGLLVAMFGTLFIVPLVYSQLIRFQDVLGAGAGALRRRLVPSATLPSEETAPAWWSRASPSEVLPSPE